MDGGNRFLTLFGFSVDEVAGVAAMPYPDGFDPDLVKKRCVRVPHAAKAR
jgi:hypothetical protein